MPDGILPPTETTAAELAAEATPAANGNPGGCATRGPVMTFPFESMIKANVPEPPPPKMKP